MWGLLKMGNYTFYMPGEERVFFKYFHLIAIAGLLFFFAMGSFYSDLAMGESFQRAIIFVAPLYLIYYVFGKRFADEVTRDFGAKKIRFTFSDERGTLERDFQEVIQVHFQYYLTFVLSDAKIMIKRPKDRKATFQILVSEFTVNRGIFASP
jgi:hypothetical protein